MHRTAIALLLLVMGTTTLTGCRYSFLSAGEPGCKRIEDDIAQRLQSNELLDLQAPHVTLGSRYTTRPCEEDGGVGWVGRNGTIDDDDNEEEVRVFYRERVALAGWHLVGETPSDPPAPGQLDLGMPSLCFDRPNNPRVVFTVSFRYVTVDEISDRFVPASDIFLEFKFRAEGVSCDL